MGLITKKAVERINAAISNGVREHSLFIEREKELIYSIYELLPDYWAVWKNRFGDYSCGDVGDITSGNSVNSEATFQGDLEYIFGCVKQKFVNNKIK